MAAAGASRFPVALTAGSARCFRARLGVAVSGPSTWIGIKTGLSSGSRLLRLDPLQLLHRQVGDVKET